jgi:hypothetical protein
VARIWRKWDIQPHRVETFKFSTDPELEFKMTRRSASVAVWYLTMRKRSSVAGKASEADPVGRE